MKTHRTAHPKQGERAAGIQRVAVWSIVGIVAVALCVAWVVLSQRRASPKRSSVTASRVHSTNAKAPARPAEKPAALPKDPEPDRLAPSNSQPTPNPDADGVASPEQSTVVPMPVPETHPLASNINESPPGSQAMGKKQATPPRLQALYQRVDIRRTPTFSIQGFETKQSLHYQVVSRLNLTRNLDPPATKVVQIVEGTKLLAADDTSRESFLRALDSLERQQYTYVLNGRGEVIEFTGNSDTRTAIPLEIASASGFQVTSVIDEDGWKELAELTFALPPTEREANEPWKRQMKHDWGTLGSWSGITTFNAGSPLNNISRIAFTREMNYSPPASSSGGLPFRIRSANFELLKSSGEISFDTKLQRVLAASEDFHVRGTVTAELGGVGVQLDLTEQQHIQITLAEQRPSLQ